MDSGSLPISLILGKSLSLSDEALDFAYCVVFEEGGDDSAANVGFVERAGVEEQVFSAGQLCEYCLAVADIKAGDG